MADQVLTDLAAKVVEDMARAKQYVTEREARRRERKAYALGYLHCARLLPHYHDDDMIEGRDKRYPKPTTTKPRTVTLSDGTSVSATTISHGPAFYFTQRTFGLGGRSGSTNNPLTLAKTPADARLLADLVERPTEEVPE